MFPDLAKGAFVLRSVLLNLTQLKRKMGGLTRTELLSKEPQHWTTSSKSLSLFSTLPHPRKASSPRSKPPSE